MKKSFTFLSVLLILLTGISFASCGLLDEAPQEEWEYKEVTYTSGENTITLDCYCIFSEEDFTYQNHDFTAGMSIMILPEFDGASEIVTEVLGEMTDDQYILKNFPLNSEVEVADGDDDTQTKSFKMSKTKWALMYYGLKWDDNDVTDPKRFLKNYSEFENIKESFSLKSLLKSFVVEKLLS